MAVAEKQRVRFGPFVLDVHSAELYKNDYKLKVQPQPIQVLCILLEHPGELVTREELQKRIWPSDTFVDFEHGLNTAVKKLRQALGDESDTPKYVETLPRRGYRFVGSVKDEDNSNTNTASFTRVRLPLSEMPVEPYQVELHQHRLRTWFALISLLLVVFGAWSKVLYRQFVPQAPRVLEVRPLIKENGLELGGHIATDGTRVYFNEMSPLAGSFLSQVSTDGGERSHIGPPWQGLGIRAISSRGTELLIQSCCPSMMRIVPLPGGPVRTVPIPSEASWAQWAPDANGYIYALNGDKDFYRAGINGENQTRLASVPDITSPRISPDGRKIRWTVQGAGAVTEDIWEMEIDGRNPHPLFPDMRGQTGYGNWTADGKLFYFLRRNGTVKTLWAVREKRGFFDFRRSTPELLYAGSLDLSFPISSRTSEEIFATGRLGQAELSVLENQKLVPFLNGISACFVTFSPDRQWIAYSSYPDGALWRSRINGTERTQLTFAPMVVLLPRWSPDGRFIAFSAWNGGEHHSIYVLPAEGGQPRILATGAAEPSDPTWSPDSKSISYSGYVGTDSAVSILDLENMKSQVIDGSERLWSPRLSPDGKYIVALTQGSSVFEAGEDVMLYSFAERKWRLLFSAKTPGWNTWSHDSRYVYAASGSSIVRAEIATGKVEPIENTGGIMGTAVSFPNWFDLTPDDRIMVLRTRQNQNIYAFRIEY